MSAPCGSMQDLADNFGFASYFNHLLKTKRSVDATFILETEDGEVEFSAHQMVLAMRSAHFADVFYGDQKEKENKIIRLEKINPKAFEDMIRYCYDFKPALETLEDICNLFRVAYEFKVMSLMNLCRTHLLDMEITPGNVFIMLEVSECMEDEKLRDKCYNFLQQKTKCVMESYKMAQVTPAMVHIILDLPKLSLKSEIELIKWLFDWANAKVEEDTICRNVREYLQNFLQCMNFLALTFEEFAMLCKDYPDFFTCEEIACISLNIAHPGTRNMPEWYGKKIKVREYMGLVLKTKLIDKDIVEAGKCVTDILALEEILKCWTEFEKCCLERFKNLKKEDENDFVSICWPLTRSFEVIYKICKRLSKIVGTNSWWYEQLESLELHEVIIEKQSKIFGTWIMVLECGGLKYLLENEAELKEACGDEEEFKEFKKMLADEKQVRKYQELLTNQKEYQTFKKMLLEFEKRQIFKVLENLDEMYKSYKERESLNEFTREMRFLMTERIGKLNEDIFELIMEFIWEMTERFKELYTKEWSKKQEVSIDLATTVEFN